MVTTAPQDGTIPQMTRPRPADQAEHAGRKRLWLATTTTSVDLAPDALADLAFIDSRTKQCQALVGSMQVGREKIISMSVRRWQWH